MTSTQASTARIWVGAYFCLTGSHRLPSRIVAVNAMRIEFAGTSRRGSVTDLGVTSSKLGNKAMRERLGELTVMVVAIEGACSSLGILSPFDPRAQAVALAVVRAAKAGERDPRKLC
jgi:hypothetical protein